MSSSISKVIVLVASLSIVLPSASAVNNGLYVTCYNSKGWCEAECPFSCFNINSCNGFPFMFACPSTLLLFLFILACIIVLGLLICCIAISCCRCYAAVKRMKNQKGFRQNDAIFRNQIIKPAPFQRPSISHHISLSAFDDFPSTQVNVTPAPRISTDSDTANGWQMEFTKPNGLNDEMNAGKKTFALHYK